MAAVFAARRRCAHKYKKYVIRALSAALTAVALCLCGRAYAISRSLECTALPEEERLDIWERLEFAPISDVEYNMNIDGIAADADNVALCLSDGELKKIIILDHEGAFIGGYSFHTSGEAQIQLDNADLIIYLLRSGVAARVTDEGRLAAMYKYEESAQNSVYLNHHVRGLRRSVGDEAFEVRMNRLIRLRQDQETVIYKSNIPPRWAIFAGGFIIMLAAVPLCLYVGFKRKKQGCAWRYHNENDV